MRIWFALAVLVVLCLSGTALAQQVGGPSGPEQGQWNIGAEGIVRDNVDILLTPDPMKLSLKSAGFYGVVEYGITDCLSLRGKVGEAKWEIPGTDAPVDLVFDYGLSWAAGLKWRICKPEEKGTALALSGQYAESTPDDLVFPGGDEGLRDGKVKEWTAALTVGVPHGSARPYAGVVYSDLQFDVDYWYPSPAGPVTVVEPLHGDKRHHVGAVVGIDHDMGDVGFFNIEARGFDEEGISGSVNFTF